MHRWRADVSANVSARGLFGMFLVSLLCLGRVFLRDAVQIEVRSGICLVGFFEDDGVTLCFVIFAELFAALKR